MKNIFVYYLATLLPILLVYWMYNLEDPKWFVISLFTYGFLYRTLIDGWRLVDKKILKWNEIWKLLLPWKYGEYITELYFRY